MVKRKNIFEMKLKYFPLLLRSIIHAYDNTRDVLLKYLAVQFYRVIIVTLTRVKI